MNWMYFTLELLAGTNLFKLVDEQGNDFTENGSLVLFASFAEAEDYLERFDIRGSIR